MKIDDMGSGYSGLKRVRMLSPNYIKLDMDLIRDVHKNPTKLALIKGLVDFSVNSGTMLIAEGTEILSAYKKRAKVRKRSISS